MKAADYIGLYHSAYTHDHPVPAIQMQMIHALRQDFEQTKTVRRISTAEGTRGLIREFHDKWTAICRQALKVEPGWVMDENAWLDFKAHKGPKATANAPARTPGQKEAREIAAHTRAAKKGPKRAARQGHVPSGKRVTWKQAS